MARHGMVLAIVLGTMAVATILLATWARTVIRGHRQQRVVERQLQTGWLVEAGIERAVTRLIGADDYTGETWNLTAQELGGPHGAAVAIQVEPVGGAPRRRIVRVQADYPDDPVRRIRRSKQITVDFERLRDTRTARQYAVQLVSRSSSFDRLGATAGLPSSAETPVGKPAVAPANSGEGESQ